AGEEEAALLRVPEVADERVVERDRRVEPAEVERRLVEVEQARDDERVVVEERRLVRRSAREAATEPPVLAHAVDDEARRAPPALDVARLAEDGSRPGEGADHEAVPAGDDLLVTVRRHAPRADGAERLPRLGEHGSETGGLEPEPGGDLRQRRRRVQDVRPV